MNCHLIDSLYVMNKIKSEAQRIQTKAEVVGKVSLLVVYHFFYSGTTEIPRKNLSGAAHRFPTPLINVEYSTDNLCQTKSNIVKGESRERRDR